VDYVKIAGLPLDAASPETWSKLINDISGAGYMMYWALEFPAPLVKLNPPQLEGVDFSKHLPQFYKTLQANVDKYVERCDRLRLVKELRAAGFITFIITDSRFDVMEPTLKFLFGNEYNSLFDIIITNAMKRRHFWKPDTPFRKLGAKKPNGYHVRENFCEEAKELKQYHTFGCGNKTELTEFLADIKGKKAADLKVLYIGDSMGSDIKKIRKDSRYRWTLAWVCTELECSPLLEYSKIKEIRCEVAVTNNWGHILFAGNSLSYLAAIAKKEADWLIADVIELSGTANPFDVATLIGRLKDIIQNEEKKEDYYSCCLF